MDTVNGINEEELRSLCMEILDYNERVLEIFDKVDDKFEELDSYYKCSAYRSLLDSYNEFRQNYQVIKSNINSYSDDLITLIQRMRENEKYLINMVVGFTNESELKANQIKA